MLKIPVGARLVLILNMGTHATTGAMIRSTRTISNKLVAGSDAEAVGLAAAAIGGLLTRPTVETQIIETSRVV